MMRLMQGVIAVLLGASIVSFGYVVLGPGGPLAVSGVSGQRVEQVPEIERLAFGSLEDGSSVANFSARAPSEGDWDFRSGYLTTIEGTDNPSTMMTVEFEAGDPGKYFVIRMIPTEQLPINVDGESRQETVQGVLADVYEFESSTVVTWQKNGMHLHAQASLTPAFTFQEFLDALESLE